MKTAITIFLFLSFQCIYAQDGTITVKKPATTCEQVQSEDDWELVEIVVTDYTKNKPKGLELKCDVVVRFGERRVTRLEDMSDKEIEELKRRAAKFKACKAYVNFSQFAGSWSIGGGGYGVKEKSKENESEKKKKKKRKKRELY